MSRFIEFIIWFVVIALVLLGIIYFSFSDNRQFLSDKDVLETQAEELVDDNNIALEQVVIQGLEPVRGLTRSDHLWGEMNAPVQLIVYTDFDCPFCDLYYEALKQVKAEFGDKVVIAFRHYPLASHRRAIPAAIAFECAGEQGEFLSMMEKLYENQKEGHNETAEFIKDAEELGLDKEQFKTCLLEERYKNEVIAQKEEADKFGVNGTPTSFLGKNILPGAYQFEDFIDQTGRQYDGLQTLINNLLQ